MLAEHWIKLVFDSTNCITLHFSKFSPNLVWIIRVHFLLFCTIFSLNSSHCFGGKKAAKDVQKCFNCNRPEDFFSRAARNRGLRMWEFCILFFCSKTFFKCFWLPKKERAWIIRQVDEWNSSYSVPWRYPSNLTLRPLNGSFYLLRVEK